MTIQPDRKIGPRGVATVIAHELNMPYQDAQAAVNAVIANRPALGWESVPATEWHRVAGIVVGDSTGDLRAAAELIVTAVEAATA